jgi:hypothetical protein
MTSKISTQYKSLQAHIALEGALIIVNSQMIKQVTHFLELSATSSVLADEQLLATV